MNNTVMSSGYLRLKAAELIEQRGTNLHRASQRGGFSYPTMYRYIKSPERIESMHMRSIVGLLVDGLGFTPEEIEQMRFGDVFEIVLDNEEGGGRGDRAGVTR